MKTEKTINLALSNAASRTKTKRKKPTNLFYWIMSLPALLHIFVFCYIPMFGIILAFKDFRYDKGIFKSDWVGLKNFQFFFTSSDAWRITRNTLGLNFIFIITGLFFSVLFALLLFEVKQRSAIKSYQTIMILPSFLSWVVVGFMTYSLLNPQIGVINNILVSLGFDPIQWYSEAKLWPWILAIINIWKGTGMSCIIYYAGLMGVDRELFDAAAIDGANKFQRIIHISLPSIIPLMTIMTILSIGGIFRSDFGMFYNLTRNVGALYSTTDVIDTYIFRALKNLGDTGMSAAVGLFQSIVGFIMIVATNFVVRKINPDNSLF